MKKKVQTCLSAKDPPNVMHKDYKKDFYVTYVSVW